MKQNALRKLCGACCCFVQIVHYLLTENWRLYVEVRIVLNLFLNFEQNEPRVLIKLFLEK